MFSGGMKTVCLLFLFAGCSSGNVTTGPVGSCPSGLDSYYTGTVGHQTIAPEPNAPASCPAMPPSGIATAVTTGIVLTPNPVGGLCLAMRI